MPVDIQSSQQAYFLHDYTAGWQCSQELASQTINWTAPQQPGSSLSAEIWYVIPDAVTPNSPGGSQEQIIVDPALLIANQPASLEGSGPNWATCEDGFGGTANPELIVAGESALSNCSTSSSTTPSTTDNGTVRGTSFSAPDVSSPAIDSGGDSTYPATIVCTTSGVPVAGNSQCFKVIVEVAHPDGTSTSETGYSPGQDVNVNGTVPAC